MRTKHFLGSKHKDTAYIRAYRTSSGHGEQSADTWRGLSCGFKYVGWGWMVEWSRQGEPLEDLEERLTIAHGRCPGDDHWSM